MYQASYSWDKTTEAEPWWLNKAIPTFSAYLRNPIDFHDRLPINHDFPPVTEYNTRMTGWQAHEFFPKRHNFESLCKPCHFFLSLHNLWKGKLQTRGETFRPQQAPCCHDTFRLGLEKSLRDERQAKGKKIVNQIVQLWDDIWKDYQQQGLRWEAVFIQMFGRPEMQATTRIQQTLSISNSVWFLI